VQVHQTEKINAAIERAKARQEKKMNKAMETLDMQKEQTPEKGAQ
jgi:hypothetical protein